MSVSSTAPAAHPVLADAPLKGRRICIVVENLPVPFDRRVWIEARTLAAAGAVVSVICPIGKNYTARYEYMDDVHIYRHDLPLEANGPLGFLLEYSAALFHQSRLTWKIFRRHGIDVIHGCNPPDLIFLVAWQFRLLGVRFLFDHHDISPELYEAKFGKRGPFWRMLRLMEWLTFKTAGVSLATNESYRRIAIGRGGMSPDDVFVVRSGPDLSKVQQVPPNDRWRAGRRYLVGYVGVMGEQEGIDLLLEAVRHIVYDRRRHDVQFALVGSGPEYERLCAMAGELGIADYVTFAGRAPDSDLFEMLCTSDVCVNPDRVNPMNDLSTMNKIMEYMAMGKPIVQFDVTEGRFSAQDASLYAAANDPIDLAAKILQLLDDEQLRATMGETGLARVRTKLGWDTQIEALIGAYQRILRKR